MLTASSRSPSEAALISFSPELPLLPSLTITLFMRQLAGLLLLLSERGPLCHVWAQCAPTAGVPLPSGVRPTDFRSHHGAERTTCVPASRRFDTATSGCLLETGSCQADPRKPRVNARRRIKTSRGVRSAARHANQAKRV